MLPTRVSLRNDIAAIALVCAAIGVGVCAPVHALPPPQDLPPADSESLLRSDDAIEQRLEQALAGDEWSGIRVAVSGGVVTLEGDVVRVGTSDAAEAIAREIDGVIFVDNRLVAARDLRRTLRSAVERLSERFYSLLALAPLLLIAAVSFAGFYVVSKIAAERVQESKRIVTNRFVRDIVKQAVRLGILLLGFLFALDLLDATAAVSAVLGTAGIFGLALGFALRDLVENYIASILLSLRHPFAPNDHVSIGGDEGHVVRLTSRATILLTPAGNHLRIPNSSVFKSTILNYSRNAKRRFDFELGVGTEENIPQALSLGTEALKSVKGVLAEPRVLSVAESLGDSTVQLRFHGWIDQTHHDLLKVKSAAIVAVKSTLDDAGIEMPEPIYRVQTVPMAKQPTAPTPASERRPRFDLDVSAERWRGRELALDRSEGDEDLLSEDSPLE